MTKKTVPFYYSASKNNLSDIANPLVIKEIFNVPVVHSYADKAELFGIGSILGKVLTNQWNIFKRIRKWSRRPAFIWSSGFIEEVSANAVLCRKINISGDQVIEVKEKLKTAFPREILTEQ